MTFVLYRQISGIALVCAIFLAFPSGSVRAQAPLDPSEEEVFSSEGEGDEEVEPEIGEHSDGQIKMIRARQIRSKTMMTLQQMADRISAVQAPVCHPQKTPTRKPIDVQAIFAFLKEKKKKEQKEAVAAKPPEPEKIKKPSKFTLLMNKVKTYAESSKVAHAISYGKKRAKGSIKKCYRFVKNMLLDAKLIPEYPNQIAAKDAGSKLKEYGFTNLLEHPDFPSPMHIDQFPKGTVLVYGGGPYGHIEVKTGEDGEGGYVSDYYSNRARTGGNMSGKDRTLIGAYVKLDEAVTMMNEEYLPYANVNRESAETPFERSKKWDSRAKVFLSAAFMHFLTYLGGVTFVPEAMAAVTASPKASQSSAQAGHPSSPQSNKGCPVKLSADRAKSAAEADQLYQNVRESVTELEKATAGTSAMTKLVNAVLCSNRHDPSAAASELLYKAKTNRGESYREALKALDQKDRAEIERQMKLESAESIDGNG